ncbi:MAG: hypothetical protein HQM13_00190 [SAR324 cluster bacterium]|nr:hypothetical protein [SAR324 cluster bacterium]
MNIRNFSILFLFLCGAAVFVGCQPANESSMKASLQVSPSAEQLRLRVSAPETIQSILVEVRATDVDTEGFGNLFNILTNSKVIYRDDFANEEDVLVAIQPGTIEVSVYAFSTVIPVTGITDVNEALYFGKTGSVTVGVGEEKEVAVNMLNAVNVSISNLTLAIVNNQYSIQFDTDQSLPTGTSIEISYNGENPDFLEFAEDYNQVISTEISGSSHSVALTTSGITPYFFKVSIDSSDEQNIYRGSDSEFCEVCGSLPLVIYDRKIAYVDETDLTQGIIKTWKTTSYSGGTAYFSKGFFDQIFVTKQFASGTAVENLEIYNLEQAAFYDPYDASVADCASSACLTIGPETASNAPADFYDEMKVLISTQITQDFSNYPSSVPFFPNTAECTEDLSRLGQDCTRIPRVDTFFIENDQLFLDVFLGENSRLEFYSKSTGLTSPPVASVDLSFPIPDTSGGKARSAGINYRELLPDLSVNYFGRVVNDEFEGSLLDFNVVHWAEMSGIEQAQPFVQKVLSSFDDLSEIAANSVDYLSMDLQAGQSYQITVEGDASAANLWEFYLIAQDQQTIVKSFGNALLGADLPEKTSITVTPAESGTYYLKIANPLVFPLLYFVTVE